MLSLSDLKTITEINNRLVLPLIVAACFIQFEFTYLPEAFQTLVTPNTPIVLRWFCFALISLLVTVAAFVFYNLVLTSLNEYFCKGMLFPIAGVIFIAFGLLAVFKATDMFPNVNPVWYATSISIGFFLLDVAKESQKRKVPNK